VDIIRRLMFPCVGEQPKNKTKSKKGESDGIVSSMTDALLEKGNVAGWPAPVCRGTSWDLF
jgi:hypothetical protein